MKHILSLALLLFSLSLARAEIPPPSATPAKVIVSGLSSTAVDIKVVKVGQQIPKTYAGDLIHNTDGFDFYVSEHYAMKSNMGDDFVRMMLEISELSLPQWEALTGLTPPDPDTRMYIVYASTLDLLRKAAADDTGRGYFSGGGITLWANHSAYNYPSGGLQYHMKDLVMHENLHMLQMVAMGNNSGLESFTYGGSQHVYDSAKKQLTLRCFDSAPINHYTESGVTALQKDFVPMQKAADALWNQGGAMGATYTHFFWDDPDRWLKWCIWRDEFYRGRLRSEPNGQVMADIFGPLDRLNADWERWVRQRRVTFHHVDWGWEQDGNAVWAYGWPNDSRYWSQMDIWYAPGETAEYDPLRMDYPAEPMPRIVGPVKRGVAEPSVGFVISGVGWGCWGGFGLGVEGRGMCQVVIVGDNRLIVDGKDMGIARKEFSLTDELKAAARSDGGRHGVTIKIKRTDLEVVVRAGKPDTMREMTNSVPIDAVQHQRLMSGHMSMIGKDGYPRITPFIDDARRMPPDLTKPAAPNRWRFDGMDRLLALYRACWRLKGDAPVSLLALRDEMLSDVDKDTETQKKAVDAYESRIVGIFRDVSNCGADDSTRASALAELTGTRFDFSWSPGMMPREVILLVSLRSLQDDPVQARINFRATPPTPGIRRKETLSFTLCPTQRVQMIVKKCDLTDPVKPTTFTATASLQWRGEDLKFSQERTAGTTCIPYWWVIGPFDNKGGGTVDTPQAVETGPVSLTNVCAGAGGKQISWHKEERPLSASLADEFVLNLADMFGGDNVSAYAVVWVICDKNVDATLALGSDDGAVVWLNGEKIFSNLVARGYWSKQNRIPIRLKAGRNQLLVKVTQGWGGWAMGAHIMDDQGNPLPGVTYSLENR